MQSFRSAPVCTLLQGFTSDSAALVAAVSGKEAERRAMAQTRSDNADDAGAIATLQAMRSNGVPALQAAQANAHAYSFGARASMTFEALNALARYLEGIPGRKNLVWFASSFPVVLFPTPAQFAQLKNNANLPGYMNHVQQTANLFTLSKIAVYPVSSAGVMNSNIGLADSADAGSAGGTGHFGTAAAPTASLTAESLNSASALAGMEQLASSTGGRAFTTNDIDSALRKIVHDSDIYYTVGYAPTDSATDGSFRRIDVKVAGGKYKLDYRQGYNADSASTNGAPSEDPIAPLLRLGLPNASGILYGVTATPSTDHGSEPAGQNAQVKDPVTRYTISFTIRAEDVFFGQAPNGERIANLLIGIKAYGRRWLCPQLAGQPRSPPALARQVRLHYQNWPPCYARSRPARQYLRPANDRRLRLEHQPVGYLGNPPRPLTSTLSEANTRVVYRVGGWGYPPSGTGHRSDLTTPKSGKLGILH